jgi:hypothetical protein
MRRLFLAVVTAGLILLSTATATLAVPFHQHYITTPSGEVVPIALGVCTNGLQNAIDNLHANVHLGAPGQAFSSNPITLTTVLPCP